MADTGSESEQVRFERMADFFDARSEGYEKHMEKSVSSFDRFYASIAGPIPETDEVLCVLDLGCGTGLELEAILCKAPNASITGIDVSAHMLRKLRETYAHHSEQLTLIRASYLDVLLGEHSYDYVVAVMTLHHLLPAKKVSLYQRIREALRQEGAYIEGDWVVSLEEEALYRSAYEEAVGELQTSRDGSHHIDIPLSLETEKRLLTDAGFSTVEVIWRGPGSGVYVARP
jgi:tRNA (cmo5U34)-methyltransferase